MTRISYASPLGAANSLVLGDEALEHPLPPFDEEAPNPVRSMVVDRAPTTISLLGSRDRESGVAGGAGEIPLHLSRIEVALPWLPGGLTNVNDHSNCTRRLPEKHSDAHGPPRAEMPGRLRRGAPVSSQRLEHDDFDVIGAFHRSAMTRAYASRN